MMYEKKRRKIIRKESTPNDEKRNWEYFFYIEKSGELKSREKRGKIVVAHVVIEE
jgi:prephenate dehydratase